MTHVHRLEVRIAVPRRGPVKIDIDAQDVFPADQVPMPSSARPRTPGDGWLAMPA